MRHHLSKYKSNVDLDGKEQFSKYSKMDHVILDQSFGKERFIQKLSKTNCILITLPNQASTLIEASRDIIA